MPAADSHQAEASHQKVISKQPDSEKAVASPEPAAEVAPEAPPEAPQMPQLTEQSVPSGPQGPISTALPEADRKITIPTKPSRQDTFQPGSVKGLNSIVSP